MNAHCLSSFLSQEEIASIVKRLAERISEDYDQKELVLICILKGAFIFFSDLVRHLQSPVQIDFVRLDKKRTSWRGHYGKMVDTIFRL